MYTVYDIKMWEEQKSNPFSSAAREPHFFCSSRIMTSYYVSITEQRTAEILSIR